MPPSGNLAKRKAELERLEKEKKKKKNEHSDSDEVDLEPKKEKKEKEKATADPDSDLDNPSTTSPQTPNQQQYASTQPLELQVPIEVDNFTTALYALYRTRSVNKSKTRRSIEGDRYKDGTFDGTPRDLPIGHQYRDEWVYGQDKSNRRLGPNKDQLSYGGDQLEMMFFTHTSTNLYGTTKCSLFNVEEITKDDKKNKLYTKTWEKGLPINVKGGDDYVGAMFLDIDRPQDYLPADFHPDGYPFGYRAGVGLAFRPREHIKDYPYLSKDGTIKLRCDNRIAFIEVPSPKGVADVVYLGGEMFDPAMIDDNQFANHHLFFVKINLHGREHLLSVMEEPNQLKLLQHQELSRKIPEPRWFQPDGVRGNWSQALENTGSVLHRWAFKNHEYTKEERDLLLSNVPFRRTRENKTFEVLSDAFGASVMFAAGFKNLSNQTIAFKNKVTKFLTKGDKACDNPDNMCELLEQFRADFDNFQQFSDSLNRVMLDIKSELQNLTDEIIPQQHFRLADMLGRVVQQTNQDTITPEEYTRPFDLEQPITNQKLLGALVGPNPPPEIPFTLYNPADSASKSKRSPATKPTPASGSKSNLGLGFKETTTVGSKRKHSSISDIIDLDSITMLFSWGRSPGNKRARSESNAASFNVPFKPRVLSQRNLTPTPSLRKTRSSNKAPNTITGPNQGVPAQPVSTTNFAKAAFTWGNKPTYDTNQFIWRFVMPEKPRVWASTNGLSFNTIRMREALVEFGEKRGNSSNANAKKRIEDKVNNANAACTVVAKKWGGLVPINSVQVPEAEDDPDVAEDESVADQGEDNQTTKDAAPSGSPSETSSD